MIKPNELPEANQSAWGFSGEWVQATELTEDTARIETIPMTTTSVGKGDVVRFEGNNILEVVEKNGTVFHGTTTLNWKSPEWAEVERTLSAQGILVERFIPGSFGMVVPSDKEDNVDFILAECEGVELV